MIYCAMPGPVHPYGAVTVERIEKAGGWGQICWWTKAAGITAVQALSLVAFDYDRTITSITWAEAFCVIFA